MSERWYKERQREGFTRQARREGYRARSAYKLQQVADKFGILGPGDAVADLGAAPGGWSQVLVERVGPEGLVVGVDLQRVRPLPGATFLRGDFTQASVQEELAGLLGKAGRQRLDAVVSDMSPDISGAYAADQARSIHLARMALAFAARHLREGGGFVTKVFEGEDFRALRDEVRSSFRKVYEVHPPASRKSSSEVYLVGKGFTGKPPTWTEDAGEAETEPAEDGEEGPERDLPLVPSTPPPRGPAVRRRGRADSAAKPAQAP